jgi:vacuolar-type H+-ATPase subunit D/Vma8
MAFADDGIQINIRSSVRVDTAIEVCRRLATGLVRLVSVESSLYNLGNRTIFTASQPVSQVPSF